MGSLNTGGRSSSVAASAHAGCQQYLRPTFAHAWLAGGGAEGDRNLQDHPAKAWVSMEKMRSCGTVTHMPRRRRQRPEDLASQLQSALADGDHEAALALTRELEEQLRSSPNA